MTWQANLNPVVLRKKVGALVVDGFFNGLSRAGRLHPQANPGKHGVQVLENIAYKPGGETAHLLDIWRPVNHQQGQLLPTVLYIHGGGFRILSKNTHWIMALAFARRGWQVVNINYRLSPQHRFPAAIEDACDALVWLKQHAAQYDIDLDHLVFSGESAGGNLVTALTLATSWQLPQPWAQRAFATGIVPKAVLPACAVLQVTDADRVRRRKPKMRTFIADRLHEVAEAYLGPKPHDDLTLADPIHLLESTLQPDRPLPPFFAGVGTADPLLDDTRRLKRALDRRGVECEVRYYPREMHAFHALVIRPQARQFWQDQFAFLDRLKLNAQ